MTTDATIIEPIAKHVQSITLKVKFKGLRRMHVRIWLASKVMILAAFIAGCGVEIETEA